jgi:hypothetical protein
MKLKEKQTGEKITVIDIQLTRGLTVALTCVLLSVALLAYLTLMGESAVASEAGTSGEASSAQSTGMRWFYLTKSQFLGDEALTACAPGYHMASLWEIADPSSLLYNTSLGVTKLDSGQGPPAGVGGWVRTGFSPNPGGQPGMANCEAWSSESGEGSRASLATKWTEEDYKDVGVWYTQTWPCDWSWYVWCIKD